MAQFLAFLAEQWVLVTGLVVCIVLLLQHESRKGGPSITPQQLINQVNQDDAVVVDLRDPAEFRKGHIVDALNVPHSKLADSLSELETYKDKPMILVCKLGQHSGMAGKTLAAQGFEKVSRLSGGIAQWQNAQLPLVK